MLGLGLWYVGFVLMINALWMMGKMDAKAVIPMNIFVAAVQIGGVARIVATGATTAEFYGAAATLLFTFTYLYVAATQIWNLDVKGLGWYCLPVSIIAVPAGVLAIQGWCRWFGHTVVDVGSLMAHVLPATCQGKGYRSGNCPVHYGQCGRHPSGSLVNAH